MSSKNEENIENVKGQQRSLTALEKCVLGGKTRAALEE